MSNLTEVKRYSYYFPPRSPDQRYELFGVDTTPVEVIIDQLREYDTRINQLLETLKDKCKEGKIPKEHLDRLYKHFGAK